MEILEAIQGRRTIRLFQQKNIPDSEIRVLLDAARLASCAANLQRLRFVVARTQPLVNRILEKTVWAKLVQPKRTPEAGITGPAAFLAVTGPADAPAILHADAGAAIQNLQLAAYDLGIGCCWMGAVDRQAIGQLLDLPKDCSILYMVALGYPAEKPCSEDVGDGASVDYYLDEQNHLHVPKKTVEALSVWK